MISHRLGVCLWLCAIALVLSATAEAYTFHVTVKPVHGWAVEADAKHWSSLVALPTLIDVKSIEVRHDNLDNPCLDQWRWLNGRELWVNVKRHCLQIELAIEVADVHVNPDAVASLSVGSTEINTSYPQLSLDLINNMRTVNSRGARTVTLAVPIKIAFVCDTAEGSVWNVQNLDRSSDHGVIVYESLETRLSHRLAPQSSIQIITSHKPPYRVDQPVVSWIGRRWGEPYTNHLVPENIASQPISPVMFHAGYRSCFCGLNVICRPEASHVSGQAARSLDVILTSRPTSATMVAFALFESPETSKVFTGVVIGIVILIFMAAMISFIANGGNLLPDSRAARAYQRSVFDASVLRAEDDEENSHRIPLNTAPWSDGTDKTERKRKIYQGQTESNLPVSSATLVHSRTNAQLIRAQKALGDM